MDGTRATRARGTAALAGADGGGHRRSISGASDLIEAAMQLSEARYCLPVFNLVRAHNRGAAFSMFDAASGWQRWVFSALAVVVSVALIVWLARLERRADAAGGRAGADSGRRAGQRDRSAAAGLRRRLPAGALAAALFSGLQCRRFGDHGRRGAAAARCLLEQPPRARSLTDAHPARQSRVASVPESIGPSRSSSAPSSCSARRSMCATKWCTTATSWNGCARSARCLSRNCTRCPTGPP